MSNKSSYPGILTLFNKMASGQQHCLRFTSRLNLQLPQSKAFCLMNIRLNILRIDKWATVVFTVCPELKREHQNGKVDHTKCRIWKQNHFCKDNYLPKHYFYKVQVIIFTVQITMHICKKYKYSICIYLYLYGLMEPSTSFLILKVHFLEAFVNFQ